MSSKPKRRHTIGYKGILKDISNSPAPEKSRRRVSFAPEVTLHKITVEHSRSSSFLSVPDREIEAAADEEDKNSTVRSIFELFRARGSETASNDEKEENTSMDLTKPVELRTSEAEYSDEETKEVTMEVTQVSRTLATRELTESDEHTMELTKPISGTSNVSENIEALKSAQSPGKPLELSKSISETPEKSKALEPFESPERTMELTRPLSGILKTSEKSPEPLKLPGSSKQDNALDEDQSIENIEQTMEFTKPLFFRQLPDSMSSQTQNEGRREDLNNEEENSSDEEEDEEMTMNFTKPISLKVPSLKAPLELPTGTSGLSLQHEIPVFSKDGDKQPEALPDLNEGLHSIEKLEKIELPSSKADIAMADERHLSELEASPERASISKVPEASIATDMEVEKGTSQIGEKSISSEAEGLNDPPPNDTTENFENANPESREPQTELERVEVVPEPSMNDQIPTNDQQEPTSQAAVTSIAEEVVIELEKSIRMETREEILDQQEQSIPSDTQAHNAQSRDVEPTESMPVESQSPVKKLQPENEEALDDINPRTEAETHVDSETLENKREAAPKSPAIEPNCDSLNEEQRSLKETVNTQETIEQGDQTILPTSSPEKTALALSDKTILPLVSPDQSINSSHILEEVETGGNSTNDEDSEIQPDEKTLSNTLANSMIGSAIPLTSSPIREEYELLSPPRRLPSPEQLSTSPLRTALKKSIVPTTLPKLNLKDQTILRPKRKRVSFPEQDTRKRKLLKNKRKTITFGGFETHIIGNDSVSENEVEEIQIEEEAPEKQEIIIPNVNISKFLLDIHIKFFDDMAHSTILSASLLPLQSNARVTQLEYGMANEKLAGLELLTYGCKELKKHIKEGKLFFDELSLEFLNENPQAVKEYYSSDTITKDSIAEQLHLGKNYAKLEARKDWYTWREQLITDLIEIMRKRLSDLQAQGAIMDERRDEYEKLLLSLNEKLADIERRYHQRAFQNTFLKKNNEGKEDLVQLREELILVTDALVNTEKQLSHLKAESQELEEIIIREQEKLSQTEKVAADLEKELTLYKSLRPSELMELERSVQAYMKSHALWVEGVDESLLHLRFLGDDDTNGIKVLFDFTDMLNVGSFSFVIGPEFQFNKDIVKADERRGRMINDSMKELLKGFKSNSNNLLNVFEDFKVCVRELQRDFARLYYLCVKKRGKVYFDEGNLCVSMRKQAHSNPIDVFKQLGFSINA